MNVELLVAHLAAAKSTFVAAAAECEALLAILGPAQQGGALPASNTAPEGCDHPEHLRIPTSTLREPPSFHCRQCRQEIVGA